MSTVSQSQVYDVIVIGAGIMGCTSAYSHAKSGLNTLLLEQFPLPHSRGSSHGQSRMIRGAYGNCIDYGRMMPDAYRLWEEVQEEGGQQLYVKTGALVLIDTQEELESNLICYQTCNLPHKYLTEKDLSEQFPMLNTEGCQGIFEYGGGALMANKALETFQRLFVKHGGRLNDHEPVLDIIPGSIVTVKTNKNIYKTKNLVVTTGAWTGTLLKPLGIHLRIEPLRINVYYWKKNESFNFKHVLLERTANDSYFIPELEYPGFVKFLWFYGHPTDADERDKSVAAESAYLSRSIRKRFTGLEDKPSIIETCMYACTPDELCVIDRHPKHRNIIIASGFSGSGFKLGPVVGVIVDELVRNVIPCHDIRAFSLTRFPDAIIKPASL